MTVRPSTRYGVVHADTAALAEAVARVATIRAQTTDIYAVAAAAARDLLDAPGVVVSVVQGDHLVCGGVAGEVPMRVGARVPRGHSIAGAVLETREPVLCLDGLADPRTDPAHVSAHRAQSSAVVPLLYRGQPLGVISALSPRPETFDQSDLSLLATLADVVASRLAYALALDEQAEVKARLDDQRTLLGAVFDGISEGVVVHDLDEIIVTANPAAAAILATPLERLRGSSMLDQQFVLVDEEGTPIPDERRPVPAALRDGRRQPPVVLGVCHPGAATSWISVTSAPIRDPDSGVVTGVVSSFRDITAERAAQQDLENTRRRLVAAQQLTGLATWEWDLDTETLRWSPQMFALVGLPPGSPVPTLEQFLDRIHPDDREDLRRLGREARWRRTGAQDVFRVVLEDGEVRHLLTWSDVSRDAAGTVTGLRGATVDVSDRVQATALATISEERFRIAFENAPIGMTIVSLRPDTLGQVLRANETFARMIDREPGTVARLRVEDVTDPLDREADRARLALLASGESSRLSFEKRYLRADGTAVPAWVTTSVTMDSDGAPLYVISHCLDLTERMRTQADLERLALTDTLTGLANRSLLADRITNALARLARAPGSMVAVLMIDLDRFKLVNDTLGHQAGDALLVQVAERLRSVNRIDTTIARPGGDEFVIVVEGLHDAREANAVADRLVAALREPYVLDGASEAIVTTASIGVTLAADAHRRPDDLLREADLALYRAKDAGRDQWALFDDALRARAVARVDVERRLRRALTEGGLRLVYQPVGDLRTNTWIGPEALLRIDDPDLGELSPSTFIEIAEDTGLIVDIDRWVLRAALADFTSWAELGPLGVRSISVNVSARSIEQPGFAEGVEALLAEAGVDGAALRLEVTERTLLQASSTTVGALTRLTAHGVGFGIDDFGTGYSALAYLQRFPLRFLKIDRSFTSQLGHSRRDDALVSAIIALGHAQDLEVVAEGVELPTQLRALQAAGCDLVQGYLLGRPMSSQAFVDLVRRGPAPAGTGSSYDAPEPAGDEADRSVSWARV